MHGRLELPYIWDVGDRFSSVEQYKIFLAENVALGDS